MKTTKRIMLFAALMCCFISASAQPFRKESKPRSLEESLQIVEKMNRQENIFTTKLDSVTMYQGDNMKVFLDYDTHFNCTRLVIDYLYDDWETEYVYEYAYDEQDRLIAMMDYEDNSKEEYVYNAQGLVEEIYRYDYRYDGTWQLYAKSVLTYDEDNRLVLSVGYDFGDGDWVESSKRTWDYEAGLLQVETDYLADGNGGWTPAEKAEYSYNEEGLCIEKIESEWYGGWTAWTKIVYQYNAQQLCSEKIVYGWGGGTWNNMYKNTYDYDEAGNLLTEIAYYLQLVTEEWEYRNRYEYVYDADNNCTDYYEYYHYFGEDDWDLETVFHTTYGTPGIACISGLSLMWDLFEFPFPISNKVEQLVLDDSEDVYCLDFHYSMADGIVEQGDNGLMLWPNPASQTVHIEGITAAEVQMYNALGQLVKTVRGTNEVDLGTLPNGLYLLEIIGRKGVVTKQIIKIQ